MRQDAAGHVGQMRFLYVVLKRVEPDREWSGAIVRLVGSRVILAVVYSS